MQESRVGPGVVVAAHRTHFFIDRNRSSLHRHGSLEDESLVREGVVGPIAENHRTRDTAQYRPRRGTIDTVSFPMQMTIAEQSVHALDVVFDEGTPRVVTLAMGQGEPATVEQRGDDPHQGTLAGLMTDDGVAPQPFFLVRSTSLESSRSWRIIDTARSCVVTMWSYGAKRRASRLATRSSMANVYPRWTATAITEHSPSPRRPVAVREAKMRSSAAAATGMRVNPHPSPIRDFEFTLLVLDADWVAIPVVGRSALRSKGVRTVPGAFVAGSPGHIDLDCERRACADLGVAPVFGQCGTEVVKLSGLTP